MREFFLKSLFLSTAVSVVVLGFVVSVQAQEPNLVAAEAAAPEEDAKPAERAPSGKKAWTERIKFKGDLRYRVEYIDDESKKDTRYRHRVRARPGLFAKIADDFDVGLQLGTGDKNDPVSNNQSLTGSLSSKPIWLDLAYFHWHPGDILEGLHVLGGKMKTPFVRVGKSELIWDSDLTFEGVTFKAQRRFGIVEPFVIGGSYAIEERQEDDDTWLHGGQAGLKLHLAGLRITVGGGYFNFDNLQGMPLVWTSGKSKGNSTVLADPNDADSGAVYEHDYDIVEGFAEVGGKVVGLPWKVFGRMAQNTAVDHKDTAWLAGAGLGKTKKTHDFSLRYIYREVKADAFVGQFTDSDFRGSGTDGKGHEVNAGFMIRKPLKLAVSYFFNEKGMKNSTDFHRMQVDFSMKF